MTGLRPPSFVIAAHGTRVPEGQAACRALGARVAGLLPEVDVRTGFVELNEPLIADAVADCLIAGAERVVVVPLMLGAGGHVLQDIPSAAREGAARVPGSTATLADHLGPAPELRAVVRRRMVEAAPDWEPPSMGVVLLGRGCSVTRANADHAHLARVLGEEGGFGACLPAFIQVVRPTLTDGLTQAYALGFRRIVVAPHFLFPGLLQRWAFQGMRDWAESHPDAEVRMADVIGDCDDLATVVAQRYRHAASSGHSAGSPAYLAGLLLRGRRVLMVGAGAVAARRITALLAAAADITVVAPQADLNIVALADDGRLTWHQRPFVDTDLEDAWYALALTDAPEVNAEVAAGAASRRIFCVRGDDAHGGSAWTPASGSDSGLSIGVLGSTSPRRTAQARDVALAAVQTWAAQQHGQP